MVQMETPGKILKDVFILNQIMFGSKTSVSRLLL